MPLAHTLIQKKAAGRGPCSVQNPAMMDKHMELAEETRGMAQGPMPAHDFMNEFLPWNDTTPKKFRNLQPSAEQLKDLTDMAMASEAQTYELFIKAFSSWPFDLKSGEKRSRYAHCVLQWNNSHASVDKFCDSLSVDLNTIDVGRPTIRRASTCKLDFTNVETHTELKPNMWDDPYCDGDAALDCEEDDYEDIEQYASDDPLADDVEDKGTDASDQECEEDNETEELDIVRDEDIAENMTGEPTEKERGDDTEPSPDEEYPFDNDTLCGQRTRGQICAYAGATMALQFWTHLFTVVIFGSYARLLRWDRSSLNPAQRGHDPRISIPMHAQGQTARKAFRHSGSGKRVFIIGAPDWHQGGYSPFERATRHGMAYCELNKTTFFYKDYWREDVPHTIPESEVYYLLVEHEIPFVAQMELGGDNGFKTISHDYASKAWARTHHQIHCLIGHLIILVTKGCPLESFETAKQLVSCVADAMEVCVSVVPALSMGTWQFISAHLLDNPNTEHSVIDNRESALYVLVWVALRNLRHSLPLELLKDMLSIFDKYVALPLQREVGGRHKRSALIAKTFSTNVRLKVPGIQNCLTTLCDTFAARYVEIIENHFVSPKLIEYQCAAQQDSLGHLEEPSWLYETLRAFAGEIVAPSEPDGIDWCDNMEMLRKVKHDAGGQKRVRMDQQESHLKRFRGHDGISMPPVSLDMKLQLQEAVLQVWEMGTSIVC
ncbi:hypothetical protein F5146DRAFT_1127193 [Armillaria mellea]|nr:hypothetical protein F5146DRAFT_1127193 [Armillaria mellea]